MLYDRVSFYRINVSAPLYRPTVPGRPSNLRRRPSDGRSVARGQSVRANYRVRGEPRAPVYPESYGEPGI